MKCRKCETEFTDDLTHCPECGEYASPARPGNFKFACEQCGQRISVPKAWAGRRAHCPGCRLELIIPEPEFEPGAEPPPPMTVSAPTAPPRLAPPPALRPAAPPVVQPVVRPATTPPVVRPVAIPAAPPTVQPATAPPPVVRPAGAPPAIGVPQRSHAPTVNLAPPLSPLGAPRAPVMRPPTVPPPPADGGWGGDGFSDDNGPLQQKPELDFDESQYRDEIVPEIPPEQLKAGIRKNLVLLVGIVGVSFAVLTIALSVGIGKLKQLADSPEFRIRSVLSRIGQSCDVYASRFDGHYPDGVGYLGLQKLVGLEELDGKRLFGDSAPSERATRFAYIGSELDNKFTWHNIPLVFEKPDQATTRGQLRVLYTHNEVQVFKFPVDQHPKSCEEAATLLKSLINEKSEGEWTIIIKNAAAIDAAERPGQKNSTESPQKNSTGN